MVPVLVHIAVLQQPFCSLVPHLEALEIFKDLGDIEGVGERRRPRTFGFLTLCWANNCDVGGVFWVQVPILQEVVPYLNT